MTPRRITRNTILVASLLALVLVLAGIVFARADVRCPIDGSGAYFTGRTQTDISGHVLYQYKCENYGHLFWVAQ